MKHWCNRGRLYRDLQGPAYEPSTGTSAHPGQARAHQGWLTRRPQADGPGQLSRESTPAHRLRGAQRHSATYGGDAHALGEEATPTTGHRSRTQGSWRPSWGGAMSLGRFDAAASLKARRQWPGTPLLLLARTTHTPSPGRREGWLAPRGCRPLHAPFPAAVSPSARCRPDFPLRQLVMYNAPEQNQESGKKREDGPAPC